MDLLRMLERAAACTDAQLWVARQLRQGATRLEIWRSADPGWQGWALGLSPDSDSLRAAIGAGASLLGRSPGEGVRGTRAHVIASQALFWLLSGGTAGPRAAALARLRTERAEKLYREPRATTRDAIALRLARLHAYALGALEIRLPHYTVNLMFTDLSEVLGESETRAELLLWAPAPPERIRSWRERKTEVWS